MQVEAIVFEDYEIINHKRTKSDFIFPVGKPKRKMLYDNDIKKAFNKFINIKTSKDAIKFARKYGLLNDFKLWLTLSASNSENNSKEVYGYRSGIDYIHLPRMCDMDITTMQNITIGLKLPKEKIDYAFVGLPKMRVFFEDITKEIGVKPTECVKYLEDKFYEDPENGSIFGIIGEVLSFSNPQSNIGWKRYIKDLNKKAKAFLQKQYNVDYENADEKIDYALEDYINRSKPIEKNVKLQYTIHKVKKQGKPNNKYFVKTDMVFNSLLDAFDTLWFVAGGILKICTVCGKFYIAQRNTSKYCSFACKKRAQRSREKA